MYSGHAASVTGNRLFGRGTVKKLGWVTPCINDTQARPFKRWLPQSWPITRSYRGVRRKALERSNHPLRETLLRLSLYIYTHTYMYMHIYIYIYFLRIGKILLPPVISFSIPDSFPRWAFFVSSLIPPRFLAVSFSFALSPLCVRLSPSVRPHPFDPSRGVTLPVFGARARASQRNSDRTSGLVRRTLLLQNIPVFLSHGVHGKKRINKWNGFYSSHRVL